MRIKTNKSLDVPHGNTIIWRYMGLHEFLDLLVRDRLFFVNADNLTDKYELSVPSKLLMERDRLKGAESRDAGELDKDAALYAYECEAVRSKTLINSWSINRHESYALWKIYLEGGKVGIAIKSSISHLKKALQEGNDPSDVDIHIAKVRYSDYIPDGQINRFTLVTTKKQFYEFENELRLFIFQSPPAGTAAPFLMERGKHIKVHLDTLVHQVYLSPFSGSWFQATLTKLIEKIHPSLLDKLAPSSIRDS